MIKQTQSSLRRFRILSSHPSIPLHDPLENTLPVCRQQCIQFTRGHMPRVDHPAPFRAAIWQLSWLLNLVALMVSLYSTSAGLFWGGRLVMEALLAVILGLYSRVLDRR